MSMMQSVIVYIITRFTVVLARASNNFWSLEKGCKLICNYRWHIQLPLFCTPCRYYFCMWGPIPMSIILLLHALLICSIMYWRCLAGYMCCALQATSVGVCFLSYVMWLLRASCFCETLTLIHLHLFTAAGLPPPWMRYGVTVAVSLNWSSRVPRRVNGWQTFPSSSYLHRSRSRRPTSVLTVRYTRQPSEKNFVVQ